jgi:hypothetical protein
MAFPTKHKSHDLKIILVIFFIMHAIFKTPSTKQAATQRKSAVHPQTGHEGPKE